MATATIEEMIEAMERRGWRLSCLSHINGYNAFSCILERKKLGDDGFGVYAANSGKLSPTAREAVAEAWANAQKPLDNSRVFRKAGATPPQPALAAWLMDHIGYRVQLEDALEANRKARTGEQEDGDDYL